MKKILCTLAVVSLASSLYAQGLVSFANNNSSLVKLQGGASAPTASTFAMLVWAPTGTATPVAWDGSKNLTDWLTANPGWSAFADSKIALGPVVGRFNKGGITVPTATAGATIDAMVAAWGGGKATFDEAYAAGEQVGVSSKFTVATGNPTTTPPGTATAITGGAAPFAGLTLAPASVIPEPSTFALAGLGAAALLIFRRRN
jgi:hypothetical protein